MILGQFKTWLLALAVLIVFSPVVTALAAEESHDHGAADADHAQQPVAPENALPPGHPPMPGANPDLPPGHPPMPGANPDLPPGHPPMGGGGGMALPLKDEPFKANLAIKVVQGTAGAGLSENITADVKFIGGDKVLKQVDVTFDKHGVAILSDVELPGSAQPYITVRNEGVTYLTIGTVMGSTAADQMLRVNVFEATTVAPEWSVPMRHVMMRRDPKGMFITEVLVIETPGDRAWAGQPLDKVVKDAAAAHKAYPKAGDSATLVLPLPEGAIDVRMVRGLDTDTTVVADGKIISTKALTPGTLKLQIAYIVPQHQGSVTVDLVAPAAVRNMVVFVPDDGTKVDATGLEVGEMPNGGKNPVRLYQATDIAATRKSTLVISGLDTQAGMAPGQTEAWSQPVSAPQSADRSSSSTRLMAGLGAGALLTAAVVIMLMKSPAKTTSTSSPK